MSAEEPHSGSEKHEAAVAYVRRKRKDVGAHGGAWKVAYADFVTAMMALFIVLWVLGQDQSVIKAVSRYFQDPSGQARRVQGSDPRQRLSSENPKDQDQGRDELKEMREKLLRELSASEEFADLLDQITIEFVNEGLRIEMVESDRDVFFEIGTSHLNDKADRLLENIGGRLGRLSNRLVVEGHTDSRPYSGGTTGYSNFELSSERANSARRALIRGGATESGIDEIRGYADRRLRDKTDPLAAVNRRISVIIRYAQEQENSGANGRHAR
jgi:chemotaxis protein MotB